MTQLSKQAYDRRVMIAMTIYVAILLTVWPLARAADTVLLKSLYALAPVPPILYVIWLMTRRVLGGDELEQRTHLIGLGVAAAVLSVYGLVSGFLAAAKVWSGDWSAAALIWIFPLLMVTYATARAIAARRYGGTGCEEKSRRWAMQFLYLAAMFSAIAAWIYWHKGDRDDFGLAAGMATSMFICASGMALWHWWRKRAGDE
jgi:hypothetical protein